LGCQDLDRFDTAEGEVYCGALVDSEFAHEGFVPNTPPVEQLEDPEGQIWMEMTFDSTRLSTSPGKISTTDAEHGICAPLPLFDDVSIRMMSEAFHDPISQLEFGSGRDYNALTWLDTTCAGTVVGVLSLMKDDRVEVRLLKPRSAPDAATEAVDRPGFALFVLRKRRTECP
jgi:hypothetical protein